MQQPLRGSIRGAEVRRVEDPRFVRGAGNYLDDMVVDDALWAVMIRSTVPHGRITGIETETAAAMPGVVRVVTAAELEFGPMPAPPLMKKAAEETRSPILARDRVRFVGDLVAAVVAESREEAFDAADRVWVDYDQLPAATTPEAALAEGAPLLFPDLGTNVVLEGGTRTDEDVLAGADVVVEATIENQRIAPLPLEPNNALAIPRPDGGADVWLGCQSAHLARKSISEALGMERELFHVRTPDMGGGFGAKINLYREQALVVALALTLGHPVRWQEGRGEGMLGMSHGRAQTQHLAIGARWDGTVTGLRWRIVQDAGAYPMSSTAGLTQRMASGSYDISAVDFRWQGVVTNTTPVDAYRGAGRPEAALGIERMMDLLADELNIDPAEIRRRNFISAESFPHVTATRERYDTGDYESALDLALTRAGYTELRAEQTRRRARNDRFQLGIGLSSYVEVTAPGNRKDWGRAEVTPDEVVIYSGALSHGHGHETTFAQLAAERLGVDFERIRFVQGDTDHVAAGGGTMGSRSMQLAGTAVMRASEAVWEKGRRIIAHHREAALEDVVRFDGGRIGVAGLPDSAMTLFDIARLVSDDPSALPPDEEPGLAAEDRWVQEEATVPFGTHVSVVEIDTETGNIGVVSHVACDDCGTILNRMIVDGQVQGGVAQGIGQALWEQFRYDADGNPLTPNLATYALPTAVTVPLIDIAHTETPTDQNPLGAKGIGEAATIGSTPAVVNAVHDALRPYGVTHIDMPLTAPKIWQAING